MILFKKNKMKSFLKELKNLLKEYDAKIVLNIHFIFDTISTIIDICVKAHGCVSFFTGIDAKEFDDYLKKEIEYNKKKEFLLKMKRLFEKYDVEINSIVRTDEKQRNLVVEKYLEIIVGNSECLRTNSSKLDLKEIERLIKKGGRNGKCE